MNSMNMKFKVDNNLSKENFGKKEKEEEGLNPIFANWNAQ